MEINEVEMSEFSHDEHCYVGYLTLILLEITFCHFTTNYVSNPTVKY